MAVITREHFEGSVGPVIFAAGVGRTEDPDMLAYFAAEPDLYTISDESDQYADLSHAQLRSLAKHANLNAGGSAEELRARLREADATTDQE